MILKELLDAMDKSRDGSEKIQVCTRYGYWEDYDEMIISSELLNLIQHKAVKCFGAICEDCIRVDIDWSDEE